LDKATGASDVQAVFTNEQLTMNMKNTFSEVKFGLEAKQKIVSDIIGDVLKGIPVVSVNADIKGSLSDLDININSNLGDDLSKGFQHVLQAKIDDAKGELQKLINDKIGGPRDKLKGDIGKLTGDLTKQIDGKKAEGDKAIKDAQSQATGGSKGGKDKLQDEGKKLLNKVFGG
jgi:uncharacterized protein (TIGR03545 family)